MSPDRVATSTTSSSHDPAGTSVSASPAALPAVDVDVVVAVHDLARPVERAVASALRGADLTGVVPGGHRVRVSVMCHELEADAVRRAVLSRLDEDVADTVGAHTRFVEVRDGMGSPSGPFNAGLAAATGRYVCIIGSDDWFAPGALGSWVSRADRLGSDWLMARLETQDGEHVATPRVRPGRTTQLDFVRDRLAYRTAPLGLLRREALEGLGLLPGDGTGPLTPGMRTGGDVLLSLRLSTSGLRVDYGLDLPAYVIGTDGADRITEAVRPVAVELTALAHLLDEPWVVALPADVRRSLAVKVLRIHVLGAVRRRTSPVLWEPGEASTVQGLVRRCLDLAPDVGRALHRADEALVRDVAAARDVDDLAAAAARRGGAGRLDILLTSDPLANLDRESTVRAHAAAALSRAVPALRRAVRAAAPDPRPHAGDATGGRPLEGLRVLVLAFSPLTGDARVLKQVRHLVAAGAEVVTCGYGPAPDGVRAHVEVPPGTTNALDGRLITARAYRAAYWAQSATRWVRRRIEPGSADVVVANDTDTLPLAHALRPRLGVHADLHEFWPLWREEYPGWKARIGPYQEWICRTQLPRARSVTTVSDRIAQEYARRFGVRVEVVTNATPYAVLAPGPVGAPLRLVHTGAGLRSRAIHVMVEGVLAAARSGADVTLDLYLTSNDPPYLAELRASAQESGGVVRVHDPVPYAELMPTLNGYDIGIFVLPPVNFNYANALPNKIFDFVQARLGVVVGPTPDMADLVREHRLGLVTEGFDAAAVRAAVLAAVGSDVAAWKRASHAAAAELSDARQSRRWVDAIGAWVADRG
ncbi:glycosyltransferase [Serinicoccus sediminis]|uniref:glycosyltransferase n=1 Tax=Serinicoccus sediminis TaxID=2306021 RepID=UPI0010219C32|nr:glycosyltransferase [Serinicoccus sediminis]